MELAHASVLLQAWDMLIDQAQAVALQAQSYRGFQVGCSALVSRDWPHRWRPLLDSGTSLTQPPQHLYLEGWFAYGMVTGANRKEREDGPKTCAEAAVLEATRAQGFTRILGICIAGDLQSDSHSGIVTRVLHPCATCRGMFGAAPEFRGDTQVLLVPKRMNAHGEPEAYQQYSVEQLLALHHAT